MKRSKGIAALLLICALGSLLLGAVGAAHAQASSPDEGRWPTCAYTPAAEEHHSGPNFTVRVSFREQPIVGQRVMLTMASAEFGQTIGDIIASAHTDSDGIAHFFAIPPGVYRAHVEKALLAESKEIQVNADNTSDNAMDIEWPRSPIVTGNVRGWIVSWQKSSPQNRAELLPHKNVFVQLLDLRSGKPLASVHTDSEGFYEFPVHPDGLYVMRVGEHPDPSIDSYDRAIEIVAVAERDHMPDLMVDQICGHGLLAVADEADREKEADAQIASSTAATN